MKLTTFFLAFILIIAISLGYVYYTSGVTFDYTNPLGASITTLNSTDIISNFPSPYNTNLANINAELLGTLTPARFTATSTSASSTIQWGLEIYSGHLAIGSTATTTIRGNATSTFSQGINAAVSGGCIAINGTCLPTSSISGTGALNGLAYFDTLTTIAATSSQPLYIGSVNATTTTASIFTGGFVSQASSTFSSGAFRVEGAATFPGGVTITCSSCITDANVSNTLTASDLVALSSVVSDAEVDDNLTISGGTINNSAIGATTPLTAAFTTLSSTGLYSLFGNLTATSTLTLQAGGILDLSAATTNKVPVSASSTLTATGELEIDSNDRTVDFNAAGTNYRLSATTTFGFSLSSTTAAEDSLIPVTKNGRYVITEVRAASSMMDANTISTTTGYLFQLAHGTNKGNRANLTSASMNTTLPTSGTSTYTTFCASGCNVAITFNDNVVEVGELWWLTTSAASSSLNTLTVQVFGYEIQ